MPPPTPDQVATLVAHIHAVGLTPNEDERKWDHMGALIVDAALQPRTVYKTTVWPRANKVRTLWPDAATLSGFIARLDTEDLSTVLVWRATSPKLPKIRDIATVLESLGVETVTDLAGRYRDPDLAADTTRALRRVKHVGPKTLDYIPILTGSKLFVAVDQHVAAFVAAAGLPSRDYQQVAGFVRAAAEALGCTPGALDAAIWDHMSAQTGAR